MDLVENKVIKAEGYDGDFMQDAKWKSFFPSATSARRRSSARRQYLAGR
jgi:hypothetical protein